MIKWSKLLKDEIEAISKIATRAVEEGFDGSKATLNMDLSACHIVTPLRLHDLLTAEGSNFLHDIYGITDNIDRETGKMLNCFSPRYTA
ncbi:hypothetical protein LCGC14_0885310 [marine sediment metagenome]|uniref:DUF6874 domain-containing protein n=1 Tax=marine sediment metagenome TaxID=412755 RepID=A0A0F9RK95_9ZZZZ